MNGIRLCRAAACSAGVVAAVALGLPSCGGEVGDLGGADEESHAVVSESAEAQTLLTRLQTEFVIRPAQLAAPSGEPEDQLLLRPQAAIGASAAARFVRQGALLVPERAHSAERSLDVRLADRADGAFSLLDAKSGLGATVRLLSARQGEAAVADGLVVYEHGLGGGTDVIQRVTEAGLEDYVRFEREPAEQALRYAIELNDEVAGLRLVDNTLELLEPSGAPRIRVTSPWVADAEGTLGHASLEIERCAADRDPRGPWGRPVVSPLARECVLVVSWSSQGMRYPLLVDPWFDTSNTMSAARMAHTATTMASGKVLVAGGYGTGGTVLSSAEIYDPITNTWSATWAMANTRYMHRAARISTTGDVVVAGGWGNCVAGGGYCSKAEYFKETDGWHTAGTMTTSRALHGFTVTQDTSGNEAVLASGGNNAGGAVIQAELYRPATNDWLPAANLATARFRHTATALLPGGSTHRDVIAAGGYTGTTVLASVERYNTTTRTWSACTAMSGGRFEHSAELLDSGKVLVAGGVRTASAGSTCWQRGAVYDPAANSWTDTGLQGVPRCWHASAKLDSGRVLIMGGRQTYDGLAIKSADLYDPATNNWAIAASMKYERASFPAALFLKSSAHWVLVSGGVYNGSPRSDAEYYTP